MKKITLILLAISFFGCSSNDNSNEIITDPVDRKLVKEIETNLITNEVETINYSYVDGILTESEEIENNGDKYKTLYKYNDYNNIKELTYLKNGIDDGSKLFFYQSGVITSTLTGDAYDGVNLIKYIENSYDYNNNNSLKRDTQTTEGLFNYRTEIEHKNTTIDGINVTIETTYDSNKNIVQKITYESDLANSPYLNMLPTSYYKVMFPLSAQNVAKKIMLNGDVYTYEYIYKDGIPSQVIEKLNGVPQSKTMYTYN